MQGGSSERRSDSPQPVRLVSRWMLSALQTVFGIQIETFKIICQQPPHPQTKAPRQRLNPRQELILPRLRDSLSLEFGIRPQSYLLVCCALEIGCEGKSG